MIQNLNKLSKEQLLHVAAQHGCIVDKRHSSATIIQEIISKIEVKPVVRKEVEKVEIVEPVFITPEELEAAIAPIKARQPAFTTEYNLDENTVHFRCRGAEECHNLSVPLKQLKKRAEYVSHGALRLKGHSSEHFGQGTATGKSAYTNVVLA